MAEAFVTLATNDKYCLGAMVVGSSLRSVGTTRAIVCMITPEVSESMRLTLGKVFDQIYLVNLLDSQDQSNLFLLERPDLGVTFTKLHCWRLEQYKKCVFLDADTMVVRNCDELFEREEFSAAPDPGWPDCFNSGVFVYTPSRETYGKLLEFAKDKGSFDGGDQGLLNMYFSDWAHTDIKKHLPFIYNVVSQAFYSYLPAFKQFGASTKICHFIGPVKPWHHQYNEAEGTPVPQSGTGFSTEFLNRWWQIFRSSVLPLLNRSYAEPEPNAGRSIVDVLMPQLAGLTISTSSQPGGAGSAVPVYSPKSLDEHQQAWEKGVIDYTGVDSFANIKSHLDKKLSAESVATAASTSADVRPKTTQISPTSTSSGSMSQSSKPIRGVLKKPKE